MNGLQHREIVSTLLAGARRDWPQRARRDYRAAGWRIIEPGTPAGAHLGFNGRDWHAASFLAERDSAVEIALIWAKQPGRGAFSRLLARLEADGYVVHVVAPLPAMEGILLHKGFMPFTTGTTFEDRVTKWRRP